MRVHYRPAARVLTSDAWGRGGSGPRDGDPHGRVVALHPRARAIGPALPSEPVAPLSRQSDGAADLVVGFAPILPTLDVAQSCRFYGELGFAITPLHDGSAMLEVGGHTLLLCHFPDCRLGEALLLQIIVTDLRAWWRRVAALGLERRYPVPAPRPPARQSWGAEAVQVQDPSGVLWIVTGRSAGRDPVPD